MGMYDYYRAYWLQDLQETAEQRAMSIQNQRRLAMADEERRVPQSMSPYADPAQIAATVAARQADVAAYYDALTAQLQQETAQQAAQIYQDYDQKERQYAELGGQRADAPRFATGGSAPMDADPPEESAIGRFFSWFS